HEPRLAFCFQFARPGLQPSNCGVGCKAVIAVSTNRSVNQITESQEIREPVRFDHVTVLEQWRVDRLVCCIERTAGIPLSLIGSVGQFPLYPQKRTSRNSLGMSALCQKQTIATVSRPWRSFPPRLAPASPWATRTHC